MKIKILWGFIFSFCLLLASPGFAGKEFQWEPVTEKDWQTGEDTAYAGYPAVMLFEKIEADEQKLLDEKCYLTVYRRIKILNSEGRGWGDVSVPYIHKEQKIEKIQGRTILRDGSEILLDESQIFEKEILKAKGIKVKQKSFSLAGITDDCIVEYMFKLRVPEANDSWQIQKVIPLLKGEYNWKFYRGKGMYSMIYNILSNFTYPNYLLLNVDKEQVEVVKIPSSGKFKEYLFSVKNIPAYIEEVYTLLENLLTAQLRLYYGSTETEHGYWADAAALILKRLKDFNSKNQKAQEIVASFDSLESLAKKKQAAYDWLQTNIKNISFLEDDETYERNNTVDEVLERGYGTRLDINYVFLSMMELLGENCGLAFVTDRDEGLFLKEAKYWQFDRVFVVEPRLEGKFWFYSPGDLFLPMKRTPWINEGMLAFVIAGRRLYYPTIPVSSAFSNQSCRCLSLNFTEDGKIKLNVNERHSGHYARDLRLLWKLADSEEREQNLIDRLQENFPEYDLDSLTTKGMDGNGEFFTLGYQLKVSEDVQRVGDRILLNPSDFLSNIDYTFEAESRKHDIVFNYPYETVDTLKIFLPRNWIVEGAPNDTNLYKPCAQLEVKVESGGKQVSVCRRFRLNESFLPASDYPMIKSFFGSLKSIESGMLIALKQSNEEK